MNITSRLHSKSGGLIGRLLTTGLCVWLLGVAFTPALAATPTVDQAPLIIQKPLPPSIVLMLDDSGSMSWNFMPDWSYLKNNGNNDAVIDASNNGVYYNPTVTYSSPVKADGTYYTSYTDITAVPYNGFDTSPTNVNLFTYDGSDDYHDCGGLCSGSAISYNTSVEAATAPQQTYDETVNSQGKWWRSSYVDAAQVCQNLYNSHSTASNYQFTGKDQDPNGGWSDGECKFTFNASYFFQYSTGDAAGPYTVHYVAQSTDDCAFVAVPANCVAASDTSGTAAPAKDASNNALTAGQNIANWFAYYHTRILMAKSGVMNAFSAVDATYRIGFGSIDGGDNGNKNYLNLPASRYSYTDSYNYGSNYVANVAPFGDGSVSGDQKNALWNWIGAAKASGGTPLRQALDAVGQYYKTGQPWQTSTSDTTELACRQSYTILTTDGFWNDDAPANIGNVDNTAAGPISRPNNLPTVTYNPALPYSDSNSDTLADVAMKYWVTDLRSASNEVPPSKEDPAYWQHMVTFTLGMGFDPVYSSGGATIPVDQVFAWANGDNTQAIPNFAWPTPASNSIKNIADLAHAAVNGHGGFASAKTPDEFSTALKKALQRASNRVGSGASLAANSTQLKTGAFAYQANYFTGDWKGDLKAIAVNPNDGTLATTSTWTASGELPAASDRTIYTCATCVTEGAATAAAVAFKAIGNLSSAEQTALGSDATSQQNMLDYLRGDGSKEIGQKDGTYRARTTPLGDIVDSQPVYVGQPDANQFIGQSFTGSDSYASYAATTRNGLIFVAANDGMLHAFYTEDIAKTATTAAIAAGTEAYAYLPAAVITTNTSTTTPKRTTSDLTTLADPDYGTTTSVPHQFFNDGELTVADVYFGSAWHTVAVGTTGRGLAKAIYALDVTSPAAPSLLWERSAGDTKGNADYIGQMIGKPVIAQTNDGVWSVLIGNGYNSKNNVAALLQFQISDGTLTVHQTDSTTNNGLAAPAVWMDDLSTGISTMAYAGDAKGRVWSFLLNHLVKSGNKYTPTADPSSSGTNLFIAKDSAGTVQPITGGMLAGKNPVTHDLWVFFGTGQYLSNSDLATKTTQSWYGLIVQADAKSGSKVVTTSTTRTSTVTQLKQRSIIAETPGTDAVLNTDGTIKTAAIAPARAVTALPVPSDMTGMSGWYIDLLSPTSSTATDGTVTYTPNKTAEGERIVTPNQFQGNQLLATTRIPEAVDLCNPSGRGWIMSVDPFTGTNPTSSYFDLNGDGLINQPADYIMVNGKAVATSGIGFSSLPNNPIFMGGSMLVSFDNGSATSIKTSGNSNTLQRVSWRELIAQ